jgi:hypothetical protein
MVGFRKVRGGLIISDSNEGIKKIDRLTRKCRRKPLHTGGPRCRYYASVKGKKYWITSDAMASLGLLKKGGKVKMGKKWVDF